MRIGVVGLGVGTVAAHGSPGDLVRFYEIDPDVVRIANEHFFFVPESRSVTETIIGDARTSLERELALGGSQQFDILAIDAFSGDAIPVHLLTREAVELCWRHLCPGGAPALDIDGTEVGDNLEVRLPIAAGPRQIGVAFLKTPALLSETPRRLFLNPTVSRRAQPCLRSVTITGPFDAAGPGDLPARRSGACVALVVLRVEQRTGR